MNVEYPTSLPPGRYPISNVQFPSLNGFREVVSTGSITAMMKPSTSGPTSRRPPIVGLLSVTHPEMPSLPCSL